MCCSGSINSEAFEALDSSSITAAHKFLFESAAPNPRCRSIQVLRSAKCVVGLGGNPIAGNRDRVVVLLGSLRNVVQSFLGMSQYRLGKLTLQQLNGIPIGGYFSAAILDHSLGYKELNFDSEHTFRLHEVVAGRYVDDLILISWRRCRSCTVSLIRAVYGGCVTFDVSSDFSISGGCISHPYLDFRVFVDWGGVDFMHVP